MEFRLPLVSPLPLPDSSMAPEQAMSFEIEREIRGAFDALPNEVLRSIIGYMDIPSLSALSMTETGKREGMASLASDDVTWFALVQRRFGIGCNDKGRRHDASKHKRQGTVVAVRRVSSPMSLEGERRKRRPMSYGGATWKFAYRALSLTSRIPETSITSGSMSGGAVFASPCKRWRRRGQRNNNDGSGSGAAKYLGVWCMINHAENCRTKTVAGQGLGRRNMCLPYREDRRYLELKLCLQNTKSGFGLLAVHDLSAIRIKTLSEEEDCFNHNCENVGGETFQIVKNGPWAPQILLRRNFSDVIDGANHRNTIPSNDFGVCNNNTNLCTDGIVLHPFEVVVLSLRVSCPSDMVYETDFLSTASSIHIPVVSYDQNQPGHGDKLNCVAGTVDFATARFLEEDALWDFYSQLPGGYLSLIDRSRLIPM